MIQELQLMLMKAMLKLIKINLNDFYPVANKVGEFFEKK